MKEREMAWRGRKINELFAQFCLSLSLSFSDHNKPEIEGQVFNESTLGKLLGKLSVSSKPIAQYRQMTNLFTNHYMKMAKFFSQRVQAETPPWKFDVLNITYENQTPDKLDLEVKITHPSRGVTALTGWIDIKEDITDDAFIEIQLLYSKTGTGNSYSPTPFRLHKMNATQFINWPYKEYLLETLKGCAENYVELEDEPFVAPITKRRLSLNACVFGTGKMPTMMKNGFYKLEIQLSNQLVGYACARREVDLIIPRPPYLLIPIPFPHKCDRKISAGIGKKLKHALTTPYTQIMSFYVYLGNNGMFLHKSREHRGIFPKYFDINICGIPRTAAQCLFRGFEMKFWFSIFAVILLGFRILQAAKPVWKFDILDVRYNIETPDKIEMELRITQSARGVYTVDGYFDFKADVTDETFFEIRILYSKTGTGNSYSPTPFHLKKMNLSEFINWPYKEYLSNTVDECGENVFEFEGKFVPPVTKRRIILNECKFNTDNMPSMMKNGFYKLEVAVTKQVQVTVFILVQIYDSIY
uniref:Uncharacterized protein n=1 Tax=Glossina austeni TaxID=7395 RepID=A0A1A9UT13_GLOAU